MSVEPVSVAVTVLTYKRPATLMKLLPKLVEQVQKLPAGFTGLVRVIDNCPEASAQVSVTDFSKGQPITIEYVNETIPGISAARRRALAEAESNDLLVFIDDDEQPSPNWLPKMVTTWDEYHRPAAVAALVVPQYEVEPPEWIVTGEFFVRKNWPTGTPRQTAAANNLLLDLAQVRKLGINFAANLGLRGGEDTLFTRQLTASGGRLIWCAGAEVFDLVPADRMSPDWVFKRGYSHGSAHGMVQLSLANNIFSRILVRLKLVFGGLARSLLGLARQFWGTITKNEKMRLRNRRLVQRGLGIASSGLGHTFAEYSRN